MKTTSARPAFRTVRTTLPIGTFSKIAYFAAESGMSIPAYVRDRLIDEFAKDNIDGVDLEPFDHVPDIDIKMPGEQVASDDASGDIEDLL